MLTGLECCYFCMASLQGPIIIAASIYRATPLPFKRVLRQALAVARLLAASSVLRLVVDHMDSFAF
jgi:hypothetical protein